MDTEKISHSSTKLNAGFADKHPHRILVTEDDDVNRLVLRLLLNRMGYEIDEAEDGQKAIDAAKANAYDLIFMDLNMPGIDGIETTRRIRQLDSVGENTTIVALTADATPEARERCLQAGMDGFVTKPFKLDELEKVLRET